MELIGGIVLAPVNQRVSFLIQPRRLPSRLSAEPATYRCSPSVSRPCRRTKCMDTNLASLLQIFFTFLRQPLTEDNRTTMTAEKRKALVIESNHPLPSDYRYRLEYRTRDAYRVAEFLHDERGFAHNDIRIITDDIPGDLPTKENILKAMKTLVRGAQPGDLFFVYFSGQGIQIKRRDGHESDRLHECICAIDYRGDDLYPDSNTAGLIVDDTMHELMVKPLPPQCRLTAIFDCRNSGTSIDLVSDIPDFSPSRRSSPNFPDEYVGCRVTSRCLSVLSVSHPTHSRNSNVPDRGPPRGEYSISHLDYHDTLQGGTTHTSYGLSYGSIYPQALQSPSLRPGTPVGYDMAPHASQPPPMGPRPPTEFVPIDSV
ncbi:Caspase domain containing protein [Russula decolorans]